jgi:8-oxo-dGTP pyrophosphatase MutT (NUDIX family)
MKTLWALLGRVLFYLLLPFWFVYFRISNTRSRILLVCNNEVLLVQGWISTKEYGLPGGGSKRHETMRSCAVRELHEEVGFLASESSLTSLGVHHTKKLGFSYDAEYFVVHVSEKPEIKTQKFEIVSYAWTRLDTLNKKILDDDARYALKRYRPPLTPSLL